MIVGELVVHYLQTPIFGRWHNEITADFLPRSVIALDWVLCFGLMGGARMLSRITWERPWREELSRDRKKVLVVGAGDAGELVVREMQKTRRIRYRPVGFVDDDHKKKNLRIHGVRVVGTTRHLPTLIEEYAVEEVIIAMPSVSGRLIEDIAMSCKKANVPVKTLPGVYELIKGSVTIEQLREVQVEDILGRHEVSVDYNSIGYITGKVVMVTGAGGSIGSELSRQLAAMGPRLLVLVDHSEGNLFQIEHELQTERHFTDLVACLARHPRQDQAARRVRDPPSRDRLSRRRLQARAHDAEQPGRGLRQQQLRHHVDGRERDALRHRAAGVHLDRQGRRARDRDGPLQGALRAHRRDHGSRGRATPG